MRALLGFDIADGAIFDLSRRSTQQAVLRLIRAKKVWYVHMGTPCSVWSIARRGINNLQKARTLEVLGVDFALFTSEVVRECFRCGLKFTVENPATSKIWSFDPIAHLAALPGVFHIDFDMCEFHVNHKKPTRLLTNMISLKSLSKRCSHARSHPALKGSATTKAGAYPPELCRQWAVLAAAECPDAGFGDRSTWDATWLETLEKLVRRRDQLFIPSSVLPGRALRYLRAHQVGFGGCVGTLPAGTHDELDPSPQ